MREHSTDGASLPKPKSRWDTVNDDARVSATFVGVLIVVGWLSMYVAPVLASESRSAYWWRYAFEVGAEYDDVMVTKRPRDCDFLTAPMGRKNCRYELRVMILRTRTLPSGEQQFAIDRDARPGLRDLLPWRWPIRDTVTWLDAKAEARTAAAARLLARLKAGDSWNGGDDQGLRVVPLRPFVVVYFEKATD